MCTYFLVNPALYALYAVNCQSHRCQIIQVAVLSEMVSPYFTDTFIRSSVSTQLITVPLPTLVQNGAVAISAARARTAHSQRCQSANVESNDEHQRQSDQHIRHNVHKVKHVSVHIGVPPRSVNVLLPIDLTFERILWRPHKQTALELPALRQLELAVVAHIEQGHPILALCPSTARHFEAVNRLLGQVVLQFLTSTHRQRIRTISHMHIHSVTHQINAKVDELFEYKGHEAQSKEYEH